MICEHFIRKVYNTKNEVECEEKENEKISETLSKLMTGQQNLERRLSSECVSFNKEGLWHYHSNENIINLRVLECERSIRTWGR